MKRALTILAAAVALPLLAEEPAKKPAETRPQPAVLSPAPAPQQAESPLVAAARRANRLGKKPANVITNDTLVKSGTAGHVTTTLNQPAVMLPAEFTQPIRPTPEMVAARQADERRKALAAEEAKKLEAEAKRQRMMAAAAGYAEEGMFSEADADSTNAEREAQKQSEKPPQF